MYTLININVFFLVHPWCVVNFSFIFIMFSSFSSLISRNRKYITHTHTKCEWKRTGESLLRKFFLFYRTEMNEKRESNSFFFYSKNTEKRKWIFRLNHQHWFIDSSEKKSWSVCCCRTWWWCVCVFWDSCPFSFSNFVSNFALYSVFNLNFFPFCLNIIIFVIYFLLSSQ